MNCRRRLLQGLEPADFDGEGGGAADEGERFHGMKDRVKGWGRAGIGPRLQLAGPLSKAARKPGLVSRRKGAAEGLVTEAGAGFRHGFGFLLGFGVEAGGGAVVALVEFGGGSGREPIAGANGHGSKRESICPEPAERDGVRRSSGWERSKQAPLEPISPGIPFPSLPPPWHRHCGGGCFQSFPRRCGMPEWRGGRGPRRQRCGRRLRRKRDCRRRFR